MSALSEVFKANPLWDGDGVQGVGQPRGKAGKWVGTGSVARRAGKKLNPKTFYTKAERDDDDRVSASKHLASKLEASISKKKASDFVKHIKKVNKHSERYILDPKKDDYYNAAYYLIERWQTGSSGDPYMDAMQHRAKKLFKLEETWDENINDYKGEIDPFNDVIDVALKSMYEDTQKYFKDKGITEVEMYRGYRHPRKKKEGEQDAIFQPLTSWSFDEKESQTFGNAKLTATIPVEDIFSIGKFGIGEPYQSEFVILGKQRKVHLTWVKSHKNMRLQREEWSRRNAIS